MRGCWVCGEVVLELAMCLVETVRPIEIQTRLENRAGKRIQVQALGLVRGCLAERLG
jgi:hypothetical protein